MVLFCPNSLSKCYAKCYNSIKGVTSHSSTYSFNKSCIFVCSQLSYFASFSSLLPVAVIKYSDQSQLGEERVYLVYSPSPMEANTGSQGEDLEVDTEAETKE